MHLKQYPRASFWPMMIWSWPQNAHTCATNVLRRLCDANLTWGVCILKMVIPRCQSQCLFHVSVQNLTVPGNTVINMPYATMQCFHTLSISQLSQVFNSFLLLSFGLSHTEERSKNTTHVILQIIKPWNQVVVTFLKVCFLSCLPILKHRHLDWIIVPCNIKLHVYRGLCVRFSFS